MSNDFHLFPDAADDVGIDPDIALISAYLARELTRTQIIAVQERLTRDAAFRQKVEPIIAAMSLPGSWDAGAAEAAMSRAERTTSLTRAELDEGWERHLAFREHRVTRGASTVVQHGVRRRSIIRAAAVIAAIVVPAFAVAQLIAYLAKQQEVPQHGIVRPLAPRRFSSGADEQQGRAFRLESNAQNAPPLVNLTRPTATSTHVFGAIVGMKETSDGFVLVNDNKQRQLYRLDKSLVIADVPLDSTPGTAKFWGPLRSYFGNFYSFVGDSALVPHFGARGSLRVIDGRGKVIRGLDFGFLSGHFYLGLDGDFDVLGRLVFASPPENTSRGVTTVLVPESDFIPAPPQAPGRVARGGGGENPGYVRVGIVNRGDSLAITRAYFDARRFDTVGFFGSPVTQPGLQGTSPTGDGRVVVRYGPDGKPLSAREIVNPLYPVDAWTLLSDGTVAVVRGRDYHVDWIHADGRVTSSARLPFDWKALTDEDKQRLVDSTRACLDSIDAWAYPATMAEAAKRDSQAVAAGNTNARLWTPPPVPRRPACYPLVSRGALGGTDSPPAIRRMKYEIVPLAQIADYYPPINKRAAIGDRDGNVWILPRMTSLSKQGELVYDVVNPERGLVRRVRLPLGRSIVAFGKNGAVYLQRGNMTDGFVLERYVVSQ